MRAGRPAVDLDVLNTAVFADRRLRLGYRHSGTTEPRTYTVDPYGLVLKAGVWYLVADHRAVPGLYRADRVRDATLTDALHAAATAWNWATSGSRCAGRWSCARPPST